MFFNSLEYFIFLPTVFLLYYLVGDKFRWLVLLTASIGFYGALGAPYLVVALAAVATSSYFFGIWIDQCAVEEKKKRLLWMGIGVNLLVLVSLKYLPFLSKNFNALSSAFHSGFTLAASPILISIGVSYYVFQAISYLVDIYLEIEEPELHFGYFSLYLGFFSKLLQGPIERAVDLLPQLKKKYEFSYDNIRMGMLLFAWGLFKKVVVADRLALIVNPIYNNVSSYTGIPLLMATYLYAIQIYCDFSGYTDMALGTAKIFNIELTQNFNAPYFATSIADFWRRWHISFSRWILDYIFKPLQMQWRGHKRFGTAAALIVTFIVSGIWHGASWCFVAWGGVHGCYLATSVFYKPYQNKILKKYRLEKSKIVKVWQMVITFNLVCFAWIFFRSSTIGDSFHILSAVTKDIPNLFNIKYVMLQFRGIGLEVGDFITTIVFSLAVVFITAFESNNSSFWADVLIKPVWVRWGVYYSIVILILFYMPSNNTKNFIYFQF